MLRQWHLIGCAVITVIFLTFSLSASDDISASDAELEFQLGSLLLQESRYEEALVAFKRASQSPDAALVSLARQGKIRVELALAEFGAAQIDAAALLRDEPSSITAQTLYADSLWASGLFDEAEAVYVSALERDPESSRARYGWARSLATKNRLHEALNEALVASAASPLDPDIYHDIGQIYERLNRFPEAANAYESYVNFLPHKEENDRALWSLAQVDFLRAFDGKTPMQIESRPELRHTVSFRLRNGKIIIPVRLNGRPREMVLDTGAEKNVISEVTASRLGIRPITYTLSAGVCEVGLRGLQLGRLDSFQIGSLNVNHVPVLIKSPGLTGIPSREPDSFSPLALGLSVTIDYQNHSLTMGYELEEEASDFSLPMRVHRLAMVRGLLNESHPAYFVVDTGGEVISISQSTAGILNMRPPRHIPLKVYGVSGWDREAFLLPGVDLQFQDIHYQNFPVLVLNLRVPSILLGFDLGGIVGHKFLASYRVTMDLVKSELRLKSY